MKGLLIKVNDYYYLRESYKTGIGGAVCERTLGTTNSQGELGKLSKANCDSLFGIVDVEKLADDMHESYPDWAPPVEHYDYSRGVVDGFNKAMELNKDKVFTIEDCKKLMKSASYGWFEKDFDKHIQSLQQPTEIEVEVVMQCIDPNCDGVNKKGVCIPGNKPKLDENGCLILKKVMS
jgi:hypothetical protein